MTRSYGTCVVLCSCNGEPFIKQQLESIHQQTSAVDEVIVFDDASTDGTVEALESFEPMLRIAYHRNARRLGPAENFGVALSAVDADVVFLCDQDDRWKPTKVEQVRTRFLDTKTALLVASDASIIDAAAQSTGRRLSAALDLRNAAGWTARHWMRALLKRNLITGATCAVRRELLDIALPIPPGFWHDEWLALVAAACDGIVWIEDCLTDYRIHNNNAAGLRGIGVTAFVTGALSGGLAHHAAKAARLQLLVDRLRSLGPRVVPERLQQAEAAVAFWACRASLPRSVGRRTAIVAAMVRSDAYTNYGDGLKSALRDLLGA